MFEIDVFQKMAEVIASEFGEGVGEEGRLKVVEIHEFHLFFQGSNGLVYILFLNFTFPHRELIIIYFLLTFASIKSLQRKAYLSHEV